SSARHKVRPPSLTGAGTRRAAWSRHQLALDRPHRAPATPAGTSKELTVGPAGAGPGCCAAEGAWRRTGGLAGTAHLLPGAGPAVAHADTQPGQVPLRLSRGLVGAGLDGLFQFGAPVHEPVGGRRGG